MLIGLVATLVIGSVIIPVGGLFAACLDRIS